MRALPTAILLLATLPALADEWPELAFRQVPSGLNAPTHVTSARDGSGRLFVVQQTGQVRVMKDGQLLPTPYLDLSSKVSCCGERGLLSIAIDSSKRVYADYTDRNGDTVIARYRAAGDAADAGSEEILLTIPQPYSNHNGGQLAFGPDDGYLYIGTGDGGSGGDPQNRAQDLTTLLGKILRIDVSPAQGYAIPPSNPFAHAASSRPEIWAYGLRNPWRFSFDRLTGNLFIADVGQGAWEEIDVQPAASGGGENYGWRLREGTHCYNPSSGCPSAGLTPPVVEYSHSDGCSVTGGFVYRGSLYPRLYGVYLYGDYCSGRIWGLRRRQGQWESRALIKTTYGITTFGEDEAGELYVADGNGGRIYQITDAAGIGVERIVPIVLDVTGRNGTRFTTELTLTNAGTTPIRVVMTYTAATVLGATGSGTIEESLGSGRQLVLTDAIAYLRGKGLSIPEGPGQGGTLRLLFSGLSSPTAAGALARTTTPSGRGRAGLAYPAVNVSRAEPYGALGPALLGLRENDQDRSNLAVVHAGLDAPITLQVTLYPPAGEPKVLPAIELAPGQWRQLDSVLAGSGLGEGLARVTRVAGTDPFLAYAVINDNVTGDGSYVRGDTAAPLPVVVETPSYETEVVVADSRVTSPGLFLVLDYYPSLPAPTSLLTYTEPIEVRQARFPSLLDYLRSKGVPLPARGTTNAGVLNGGITDGDPIHAFSGGAFMARVTTPSEDGRGRYGVSYGPQAPAIRSALVMGLRHDGSVRSNLGLYSLSFAPRTFDVEVFDGARGVSVGRESVTLPGGGYGWAQIDGILSGYGVTQGYVRITASPAGDFGAYGVINDGAAPGQGTGDGSYVEMAPID